MLVPGVTMRMTSRFTSPLASFGSSTCSQMATLCPFATSLFKYPSAAWYGTPHIGALSSIPQFFPVSVSSSSLETICASSKNIS